MKTIEGNVAAGGVREHAPKRTSEGAIPVLDEPPVTGAKDEPRFRQLVDAFPFPFLALSAEARCVLAGPRFLEYTGRLTECVASAGWLETVHPEDREKFLATFRSSDVTGKAFDPCRLLGRDRAYRWFDVRIAPIPDDARTPPRWFVSFLDIDESYRAREQLLAEREAACERERVMREVAESIREVVWLTDKTKSAMIYVSPAYERVWGRSCASLYKAPQDWLTAVHPEDRERIRAASARQGSELYDEEYRIVRPDGVVRWIRDRAAPVYGAGGEVVRIAGVAEDITERRDLEAQLRATQKMESIGLLAGGVAHDFNNLLTIIIACTDELLQDIPDSDPGREPLLETRLAVQRGASLTRDLLAFSRRQRQEPKVADLNEIVAEADRMLRRVLGEDVQLVTSLAPDLGRVKIDPSQWTSILVNLAVNARHAMPQGGTLTLRTRNVTVDASPASSTHGAAPGASRSVFAGGQCALLEVADTGVGFPQEVASRIFEPFFTTKGVGKGTGLGLAVVHGIVQQSGGTISVSSEPGVGTLFRILLPIASDPAPATRSSIIPELAGTETVLFVEDEAAVRRTAIRGLESRGFKVLAASDAEEALEMLGGHANAVDILVTDVVLPRMDGRSLVEQVKRDHPRVKVLYTSGYTNDEVLRYGLLSSDVAFLEKPYTPRSLVRKMREVLDAIQG